MPEEINAHAHPEFDLERLAGVAVSVRIRLGRTTLSLGDAMELSQGDRVRLSSSVEDNVEILVGENVIAEGELVVVDGDYAVRVVRTVNQNDRFRTVGSPA